MGSLNQFEARNVKAKLEIGKVVVPVTSIDLAHTIDEFPMAQIGLALDNQSGLGLTAPDSVTISVEKLRKLAKLMQEKIQNEYRLKPDVRLTVTDDSGVVLVFNGFLSRPEIEIQEGQLQIRVGLIHAKTVLQAWNGQIYQTLEPYIMPDWSQAFDPKTATPEAKRAEKSGSVSMKVLALLEYCMRSVYHVPDLESPTSFDLLPIHKLNEQVLQTVLEVLKVSEASTFIDGLDTEEFNQGNLYAALRSTLVDQPNMWMALKDLISQFLFQINADWAGNMWLEQTQTLNDPETRVIQVPLSQLHIDLTHMMELPLAQVAIIGAEDGLFIYSGMQGVNQGSEESPDRFTPVPVGALASGRSVKDGELWASLRSQAIYPERIDRGAAGVVYVLRAPYWISTSVIDDAAFDAVAKSVDKKVSRLVQTADAIRKLRDHQLASNVPRKKVLNYVAKQLFQTLYLQGTRALLTIPFDVRPCVGRTYRVVDIGGQELCTAFLQTVNHNLTLNPDGSSAKTTLHLSHVRIAGAVLQQLQKKLPTPETNTLGPDAVDSTFKTPSSVAGAV